MIRQTDAVDTLPDDGILSVLAAATDDILWLFTADWETVVFINDAYEDIWERPLAALEDDPQDFMHGVHPEDRDAVREMMERVSAGEAVEIEIRVNDSEFDRWVQVQTRPVSTDGEVTHVAGFTRDVTDRHERERELEELTRELERSNEELQQFAYVASHDLQEPLRMVRSYMNLLDSEYGDELDDADATVDAEPLPTVTGDREQLSRVFQNLISNAIEYTEDGPPTVEIRGDDRGSEYVFAVEDDGVGFPEGNASEMFDIFQRGPDADNGGTGIGLAITKRIVERHGGEVWVESTPGAGSTVYFSLAKTPGGERGSDS
jgi:PAS domain S-box-containing protein